VRKYRIKQNLSQEELAEKAGVHRTYIGSVERGERNITINVMEKICTALEIPITNLFKE
jgi:transcriptional regulator with XRE-family HTH domain